MLRLPKYPIPPQAGGSGSPSEACCTSVLLFLLHAVLVFVFYLMWLYLELGTPSQVGELPCSSQGPAHTNRSRIGSRSVSEEPGDTGAPDPGSSPATHWTPETLPGVLQAKGAAGMDVPAAPPPSRATKTPQKRRLEALGALHYVLAFWLLAPFSIALFIYMLFTRLWFLTVLYLMWIYLDRDTPSQGGRRNDSTRHWEIWKHQRDYFPIKLVKTAELPPNKNYVLGAHPHGIMTTAPFCNILTECNSFSRRFPGLQPWIATLAGIFYIPVFRDYIMLIGLRPASRHSLDFVLSQPQMGKAVVITIGGVREALYTAPGRHCLKLLNRKGFIRLALRHGASLVPMYSFGENDIFKCKAFPRGSWQYMWQVTYKKITGLPLCICWGRSIFSRNSWGLLPFPKPMTTVVGAPIPVPQLSVPTVEQVDHYHRLYMEALERLFEEHKESCGVPTSTHLTFR